MQNEKQNTNDDGKQEEYASVEGKNFVVFGNRIMVKKLKPPKKGILEMPDNITDKAEWRHARVVQVGPACQVRVAKEIEKGIPEDFNDIVEVGNIVLIPDFAGSDVELNGEEFMIIREDEIIGKFE